MLHGDASRYKTKPSDFTVTVSVMLQLDRTRVVIVVRHGPQGQCTVLTVRCRHSFCRAGCGVTMMAGSSVSGGQPADPKQWPWMVALLKDKVGHFCGGVLITDLHVLTAAHCVHG